MIGRLSSGSDYFGLIVCGALFLCGGIVGITAAGFVNGSAALDFLAGYLSRAGESPAHIGSFVSAFLSAGLYPFAAVFFGFSVLGVFCIPALSAVRGFFLCFSISVVVRHFGGSGISLSLALFGINALFTVPCFFILSVQSFTSSFQLFKSVTATSSVTRPYGGGFFRRIAVCSAILAVSALIDTLVIPRLIIHAVARILQIN